MGKSESMQFSSSLHPLLKGERDHVFLAFKKKDDVLLDSW